MKHESKQTLKNKDLLIAESIIKGLIKKGELRSAIEICERKNISSERFGELTKLALEI